MEHGDQDHAVLDTDAKQCDKAYTGRDTEVDTGDMDGQYAAYKGKRHVQQYQDGVFYVAQHSEQHNKDGYDTYRFHLRHPSGGAYLVLDFARPAYAVAFRQFNGGVHFGLRFRDGA